MNQPVDGRAANRVAARKLLEPVSLTLAPGHARSRRAHLPRSPGAGPQHSQTPSALEALGIRRTKELGCQLPEEGRQQAGERRGQACAKS